MNTAVEQTPHGLDVLVVAAHPDDAEISVGGTIAGCVRRGKRVGIVDLTDGEPTPHGSRELRAFETRLATRELQVPYRKNLQLPNRSLQPTLEARRSLAGVFRQTRPEVILAPYWEDAHPDHVVASRLVDDARFWAKLSKSDLPGEPFHPPRIYYYWSIHLRIHPQPSFVMDISEDIGTKLAAVRCYESQLSKGRSRDFPTIQDDIRDRARYWGWAIGRAFGEPFASRENLGIQSFDDFR